MPTASINSLVKDLVNQFDRPLDFYRELIQNSIDAASNRIDVTLRYDDAKGLAVIGIEDDGEGMDEKIIDDYLLVLFKSTKEDDFTKIGKFGIGFVSVFAIDPELVRVLTAKNGESWRLDFPSYKRWDKYRLSEPREGTLVELHKRMSRQDYDKLARDSLLTIKYWCKHADTRLYFEDKSAAGGPRLVTEPFSLPRGDSLRYAEEGTEAVLGFAPEPEPFFGFYNRGLTLKEGRRAFFPGVEFKIKSRYLEHTLTRDNVIEDDHYAKALAIVGGLVKKRLPERLRVELADLALKISARAASGQAAPADDPLAGEWAKRLPFLRWLFSGLLSRWMRSNWAVFPAVGGKPLSLDGVRRSVKAAGGMLVHDAAANRVTAALAATGAQALVTGPWVAELKGWYGHATPAAEASAAFLILEPLADKALPGEVQALLKTLRALDQDSGSKYRDILAADFDYPGSCVRDRSFVAVKAPDRLCRVGETPDSSLFGLGRAKLYAVANLSHPFTRNLVGLHERRPGLAAFLCLKTMHLNDGEVPADRETAFCNLAEKVESRLISAALRLDVSRQATRAAR